MSSIGVVVDGAEICPILNSKTKNSKRAGKEATQKTKKS